MRIGFIVNQIDTEQASYTTTRLAMAAVNRGHEAWLIGAGDLALDPDDYVRARARAAPKTKYKSLDSFLEEVRGPGARADRITVDDLDVLMLRNDPAEDMVRRSWAQMAGILFGRAALRRGVIVLNDPTALALAANKMYFQLFPEEVRPATLITRDRSEIRNFAKEHGGDVVIKPLQGSGGQGVFLVRKNDLGNLNQMIEAVSRDGYVIAQVYLPEAT
jgi:glutathione synthase